MEDKCNTDKHQDNQQHHHHHHHHHQQQQQQQQQEKHHDGFVVADLTSDEISRYSRQLLLTQGWGVKGQKKLQASSVLVVGAGGIGSTVLLYLASSGVGKITVADFDDVEVSNLHRQVIHSNQKVGVNKAISACDTMKMLNPTVQCTAVTDMLTFENAMELVSVHDCVVDACDNPQTRYILNDACILNGKPLVSGSAMGSEGQLTVYGYKDSACYRCLYPKANPVEGNKSCSDNGVLGPVPGLIGILQATETLKILTDTGCTMEDRLLMYDSLRCSFMNVKKIKKRMDCAVCGTRPTICNMSDCKVASNMARGPLECGLQPQLASPKDDATNDGNASMSILNISCKEYHDKILCSSIPHLLLDVRVRNQYELCSIKGSVNMELSKLAEYVEQIQSITEDGSKAIYCICRRGVASLEATTLLSKLLPSNYIVYNIHGGLNAWVKQVDPSFPMY
jgi:adenylyltransferase/sulfurtransferase